MKKFNTVPEIISHLKEVRVKVDAFKADCPDFTLGSLVIRDLHPTLLYEIAKEFPTNRNVEYYADSIALWNHDSFGMPVWFRSVPVEKVSPELSDFKVLAEVA